MVYRSGDARFAGRTPIGAVVAALQDSSCTMVNRNAGSGTRILIDQLLLEPVVASLLSPDQRPPGYAIQAKSHNAVAAAVAQGRADWGVAIDTVARMYGLDFLPMMHEHYDFVIPKSRWNRPALTAFRELLADEQIREKLQALGFES